MKSQIICRERNPGYFPQYGAIFMANNSTREECFERQLFGLPCDYADFVMEIKTGMVLFLFDFQERKLYGVFKAASDGAMNIIPDAYNSKSYRKFPAQVRFSTLWHCDPLPEHAFCDAIKENYYAPFKFNFGLSRDQVGGLLSLFEKRMRNVPRPPVRGRQLQKSSQTGNSKAGTLSGYLENSEPFPESMQESVSEMLDTLDAFDHGSTSTAHVEDYIPLPSIEPEEIEDPSDALQWGCMSFAELAENHLKPAMWPSRHHSSKGGEDKKQGDSDTSKLATCSSGPRSISPVHKEIDGSSNIPVQGLYSDSSKNRTSVFQRLSRKVMVEERYCPYKVDNASEIIKELDNRRQMWKQKSCSDNSSKSRNSVFHRLQLQNNAGKAQENKGKTRASPGEMKFTAITDKITRQNLKRKSSCSVKIEDKSYDCLPSKQQKKRSRKHLGKYSRVTKIPNHLPDVPVFFDGSSVSTINS